MATNEILSLEKVITDNRIVEYEHVEIRPADTNYNTAGEIRIDITNENVFTRPSDSYLLVEGSLTDVATPGNYAAGDHVTLVKEGIMYLFSNIRYYINEKGSQVDISPWTSAKYAVIFTRRQRIRHYNVTRPLWRQRQSRSGWRKQYYWVPPSSKSNSVFESNRSIFILHSTEKTLWFFPRL